jgi:hypothetical protein
MSVHCRTLLSISFLTCRNEFGVRFLILLCQTNDLYGEQFPWYRKHAGQKQTLHRVASNTRKRVNACIAERGWHFQHLQEWVAWLFDHSLYGQHLKGRDLLKELGVDGRIILKLIFMYEDVVSLILLSSYICQTSLRDIWRVHYHILNCRPRGAAIYKILKCRLLTCFHDHLTVNVTMKA